jgi:golgin subfamily A protein 1
MAEVIKERDTTIRAQQQRMNDLKRTLQKELRSAQPTTTNLAESSSVDSLASGASQQQQPSMSTSTNDYDSANFAYMKHVLLRYLTGTDYQCLQLVRAVVAVLRLNEDEEAAIWDNLNYKLSWLPSAKPPKRLP